MPDFLSAIRLLPTQADALRNGKVYSQYLDADEEGAMKNPFSRDEPRKTTQVSGLESIPTGAQLIPMDVKKSYETNPVHIYHPTPYNAITVLRSRKQSHDWLVCGWYLDTYREHGVVKGLVYKAVASEEDKEHVMTELKKLDKEASIKFSLT